MRTAAHALGLSLLLCAGCGGRANLPRIAAVPAFQLRDQNGQELSAQRLRGRVWIANFIFTRCPDVCPVLTAKMAGVRTQLLAQRDQLRFVSFSVDPRHDTPAVLKKYAAERGADQPDWSFASGPAEHLQRIVVDGFKQTLLQDPSRAGNASGILHGSHFVLVDRALEIRGFYPSDEPGLLRLVRDTKRLLSERGGTS